MREDRVRHGLHLEHDVPLLALLAEEREAGGLALRGGEGGVAQSPAAAGGDDVARAVTDEVGQHLARLRRDDGPVGHPQDQVLAVGALTHVSGALAAVGGAAVRRVVVVDEGGHLAVDDQHDVAAVAPVRAVRPAERLELLAAHGGHAVPAVAARGMQDDPVDEAGHGFSSGVSCGGGGPPTAPHRRRAWSPRMREGRTAHAVRPFTKMSYR
jgi:hypothetical protein